MKIVTPFLRTAVSLLMLGCLDPNAPPAGAHPIVPPAEYRVAWQQMENCSGLQGDFGRVHWFVVPQPSFPCGEGECLGEWQPPHNIYLSEIVASGAPIAHL